MRIDTASLLVHAPASDVYTAFTTAEAMERWLPPGGMAGRMLAFDFREGGSYRLLNESLRNLADFVEGTLGR